MRYSFSARTFGLDALRRLIRRLIYSYMYAFVKVHRDININRSRS